MDLSIVLRDGHGSVVASFDEGGRDICCLCIALAL